MDPFFLPFLFSPVPNPSGPLKQVSGPADRSGRWQATGDGFCQAEGARWYFSNRNVSIEVGCKAKSWADALGQRKKEENRK